VTEAPLVVFSVPDRFEIDGPFVARAIEERDIPIVAPAFREGVRRRLLRHGDARVDATLFSLLPDQ
jgi:hypothetical protein